MTWRLEVDADVVVEKSDRNLSEPIWWEGRQWAVTAFGIERRDGTYAVDASALGEVRKSPPGDVANWLVHMWMKSGVDLDDFIKAYLIALAIHQGSYLPLESGWLARTLEQIEREAQELEEFSRKHLGGNK